MHGVAWLTKYVQDLSEKSISSLVVSHDSIFLDNVAQDMCHYEKNRKLKAEALLIATPLRPLLTVTATTTTYPATYRYLPLLAAT